MLNSSWLWRVHSCKGSSKLQKKKKETVFQTYLNRQIEMEFHFLEISVFRNTIQRMLLPEHNSGKWGVTLLLIWKTSLKEKRLRETRQEMTRVLSKEKVVGCH